MGDDDDVMVGDGDGRRRQRFPTAVTTSQLSYHCQRPASFPTAVTASHRFAPFCFICQLTGERATEFFGQ
jgi:hypothetical protein